MGRWILRIGGWTAPGVIMAAVIFTLPLWLAGDDMASSAQVLGPPASYNWDRLRVMTLNVAHGGGTGVAPVGKDPGVIRRNLDSIAETLRNASPDVVALQEIDRASGWSGAFDHGAHLAAATGLPYLVHGEHVSGLTLRYGTALLSALPLNDTASVTFPIAPPTWSKGFVVASVVFPSTDQVVDVVSLHLDFAREAVRRNQVKELVEFLEQRSAPRVVMGDLNCDQVGVAHALGEMLAALDLCIPDIGTPAVSHPASGRRLDWVLHSPQLEPVMVEVLRDEVSDHLPVVTEFRWNPASTECAGQTESM